MMLLVRELLYSVWGLFVIVLNVFVSSGILIVFFCLYGCLVWGFVNNNL